MPRHHHGRGIIGAIRDANVDLYRKRTTSRLCNRERGHRMQPLGLLEGDAAGQGLTSIIVRGYPTASTGCRGRRASQGLRSAIHQETDLENR